jgi:hypothetical protein
MHFGGLPGRLAGSGVAGPFGPGDGPMDLSPYVMNIVYIYMYMCIYIVYREHLHYTYAYFVYNLCTSHMVQPTMRWLEPEPCHPAKPHPWSLTSPMCRWYRVEQAFHHHRPDVPEQSPAVDLASSSRAAPRSCDPRDPLAFLQGLLVKTCNHCDWLQLELYDQLVIAIWFSIRSRSISLEYRLRLLQLQL